ncbi:hypothetical protein CCACVL1_24247 [Corchorus capsularis]|uniref:Uncharacterized protein n=1 Tax=Corchorus capsularis TaxID=210143 RepID=A0A1R3GQF0_COCAP|nr:hypothetical protein CCACVL1_24247 [Corchorus capsularis]
MKQQISKKKLKVRLQVKRVRAELGNINSDENCIRDEKINSEKENAVICSEFVSKERVNAGSNDEEVNDENPKNVQSSNVGPKKKGKRKVERLEKKVAAKKAETILLKQQLMEDKTRIEEASVGVISELRMVNAVLFLKTLLEEELANDLARRILG